MSVDLYRASNELLARSSLIPGGACTRSKAPGRLFDVGSGPLYAASGHGAVLRDVDGHEYIDMICGLGAISLGYEALPNAPLAGRIYSLPHHVEITAAEDVLRVVAPWASQVRFTKTGSESTHAAYRIAKVATGRSHVMVGDWAYHGWHEWCSPDHATRLTFGHGEINIDTPRLTSRRELVPAYRDDIAAVFIEPHRWEPVSVAWLQSVRDWCTRRGALLVFDEMIYGGRWALGGATEYYGITPDLACFGKAIGNGSPIACVVGRDALRDHGVLVSGTYSGDVSALECLSQTLAQYEQRKVIELLWARGRQLAAGLEQAIVASGWSGLVTREGQPVHQRLRFEGDEAARPARARQFAAGMASRGVLWHPQLVNVCAAHTEDQITQVCEAAMATLQQMGRGD